MTKAIAAAAAALALLAPAVATIGPDKVPAYGDTYRTQFVVNYELNAHGPHHFPRHTTTTLRRAR